MFRFGIFPQKKVNNINRKVIEYDQCQNYCYNPILSPLVQKELNKQAAEDKYFKCYYCKANLYSVDVWHIVNCSKCNRLNRVPRDLLESNKITEYYGDSNKAIFEANPLYVVIICPFCQTPNQVRKIAERMQCYKCENQVNLKKYLDNQNIDLLNRIMVPRAEISYENQRYFDYNQNKSDIYGEEIDYFYRRNEENKRKEMKENQEKQRIMKETDEFIEKMIEKDSAFLRRSKSKENTLNKYYDEYVKNVYKKQEVGNNYYWLNS